ncbi:hypothetical protein [Cytophaga aurantiaca]|uniref:hypothetical protein n=1 Tax=Cytophaga aurantiaca TaxID=29530 RepID=UPI000364EB27|nr:hypothetical protein [Cytophaga aurantiaca]
MKRIYVILFAAILGAGVVSCKEKTPAEKAKDHLHEAGEDIKDATDDAGDAAKDKSKEVKEDVKDATH